MARSKFQTRDQIGAGESGLISQVGESRKSFLELRQARGVYSRVTTGMSILNGSLFSEVRTLV